MRHLWIMLALIASMVMSVPSAFATVSDVSGSLTVDNHFKLYISTDDSVAGNFLTQSTINGAYVPLNDADNSAPYDWSTPESVYASLTPGVANYLHIEAYDTGVVGGVLGQLQLNNPGFKFANGASSVLTDLNSGWTVRSGGFNGTLMNLTGPYKNGESEWAFMGVTPGIDLNAHWIWTNNGYDIGSPAAPMARYFSMKINPVPEPISSSLFLLGGAGLSMFRRKKNV